MPGIFTMPGFVLRTRCFRPVQCSKGFGSQPSSSIKGSKKGAKKQAPSVNRGDPNAVERAIQLAEGGRKARPVDSREAARGRVEFVKVKDWGTGEPTDLGQLQVEASLQVQLSSDAPFYEQLAKRLELLEAQGALSVVQPKGAKPLPPFKRWAFAEAHYLQYLSDLLSVHSALEWALAQCTPTAGQPSLLPEQLQQALQLVGPEWGLFRSQQLLVDIQRLCADGPLPPSPNAAGLAQLLGSLATRYSAAESDDEAAATAVKLLAHTFVILLVLLTSGGRVGAAAAEKLDLFARGALNTFRTYPSHVKDPVDLLKSTINKWGELLSEAQREALMEELPSAMQKASLLLVPLAQE